MGWEQFPPSLPLSAAPRWGWQDFSLSQPPGDKDDYDDDDADDKLQASGLPSGEDIRQESQEQNEVDHGDFEMVVSPRLARDSGPAAQAAEERGTLGAGAGAGVLNLLLAGGSVP